MNPEHYFNEDEQEQDIKLLVTRYLRYWPWFAAGIVLMLLIAFFYNRYATPIYHTDAEIKILRDQDRGLSLSGMEGAEPLFAGRGVNLENEMRVLDSRKLMDSVATSLNLETAYFKEGNLKSSEVWEDEMPIVINWVPSKETKTSPLFSIAFNSSTDFKIEGDEKTINGVLNDTLSLEGYRFIVELNPRFEKEFNALKDARYRFQYYPKEKTINQLRSKFQIEQAGKESEVLSLAYEDVNSTKNEAIVDTLITKFNEDGMHDKQLVSKRTEVFVNERLQALNKELDTIESGLVDYKQSQGVVSIESTTKQLFGKESSAEQKRFELETEKAVTEDFKEALVNGDEYELLPANLGIESSSINKLTDKYNESVLLHDELLNSSSRRNPLVKNLEKKLDKLKANIRKSVSKHLQSLKISLESYRGKEEESGQKLHNIPSKAKGERSIERKQEVKENLYMFLLQKREEAALQYAQTSPTIKVVDFAHTNNAPVAPKTKIIYLAAFILGVLIPFGALYLKFLFDTKVGGREDIEQRLPGIPVLSEIPALSPKNSKLIGHNDRSVLAEAFRILRTNFNFYNTKKADQQGQVVFVTSTIKGEGKTFTSLNLARSMAALGKKTLVIGADLRNPQTHNYFNLDRDKLGLSAFLSDESVVMEDLLHTNLDDFKNSDLILGGQIPPNPDELLSSDRLGELLNEAKARYDYVIVDTAPTILVADTLLISHFADMTVYLMRADYTDEKLLNHVKKLHKEKRLHPIGIVLNGVKAGSGKGYGYGYTYNYGYGFGYSETTPKAWWKFWKR